MDRVDKAEAQVKAMSAQDDDATLSQLAAAWAGCALGGAKVKEASYIYQEMGDKYNWTVSERRMVGNNQYQHLRHHHHHHHHQQQYHRHYHDQCINVVAYEQH